MCIVYNTLINIIFITPGKFTSTNSVHTYNRNYKEDFSQFPVCLRGLLGILVRDGGVPGACQLLNVCRKMPKNVGSKGLGVAVEAAVEVPVVRGAEGVAGVPGPDIGCSR